MEMKYNPQKHHRRSNRKKGHDYGFPGFYFVTICTQHRACLLGKVDDGVMYANDAGQMVERVWLELCDRFDRIQLDAFVVMPNHVHGIIRLVDPVGEIVVGMPTIGAPTRGVPVMGLGDVVGAFKSITTHEYAIEVHAHRWPPFDKRLWQRNYYERIVRDDNALQNIRRYIVNNPSKWQQDKLHPHNPPKRQPPH